MLVLVSTVTLVGAATATVSAGAETPRDPQFSVMTYNINNSSKPTGWTWPDRRSLVGSVINSVSPTVLGIQEGGQGRGTRPAADLRADLASDYDTAFAPSVPTSDATSIFWKRNRFSSSYSTIRRFSNSETPCRANDYWNVVELEDLQEVGKKVRIINVHLIPGGLDEDAKKIDCPIKGETAARHAENVKRIRAVADWVGIRNAGAQMPTVILGDFNAISTHCQGISKAPDFLAGRGYTSTIPLTACTQSSTWDKWFTAPVLSGNVLDYMFRTVGLTQLGFGFAPALTSVDGKAPSDHRPFYTRYQLN